MTRLGGPLKREIVIDRKAYMLTPDGTGLKLSEKGHRRGLKIQWKEMISGDAAIAAAHQASVEGIRRPRGARARVQIAQKAKGR